MDAPEAKTIVDSLGGPARVARHLASEHPRGHVSVAAVCQWRRIPEDHCASLAELRGPDGNQYTPQEMRPDLDWVNVNGQYYCRKREAA